MRDTEDVTLKNGWAATKASVSYQGLRCLELAELRPADREQAAND